MVLILFSVMLTSHQINVDAKTGVIKHCGNTHLLLVSAEDWFGSFGYRLENEFAMPVVEPPLRSAELALDILVTFEVTIYDFVLL